MARVFVSYQEPDAVPAERLASALRQAGHTVFFAPWSIRVGDSIVERINEGLENATHFVLCPSRTEWVDREWMSTLARQLGGHNVRLLPARLTEAEPPAILADLRYADLSSNWERGLADLLRAML